MKHKNISKKVIEQHKKAVETKAEEHQSFSSLKDIKTFVSKHLLFLLFIEILIFGVYFNSLNGAFVSDDLPGYVNNPIIQSFDTATKNWHWQEITYSVIYFYFGLNPTPLHILSMILHYLSVVSFFILISNFFSKRVALFSTILFAVHPLVSETVSWISAINYLVCAIAAFWAAIFYVLFRNSRKKKYLAYSVLTFSIILLFTKASQNLAIIPILILIDQFFLERKFILSKSKDIMWFLIPLGFYLLAHAPVFQIRLDAVSPTLNIDKTPYLLTLPFSIYKTVSLMVFPDRLSLYHDSEPITPVLMGLMYTTFILLVVGIVLAWKRNRKVAGLALIAITSFAYMISPIQVAWFFAERYVYIATAFFCVLVVFLFIKLERKTRIKNLAVILLVLLTSAYSIRTFVRNNDWKTRKSLWEATARVVPLSARTHNNLGDVYAEEGNMEASIASFKRAVELNPNYSDALHNLGYTYAIVGEWDLAEENLLKSIEANPNLFQAYFQLAGVEYKRGNVDKTKEYLQKALEINPNFTIAKQALESL